MNLTQSSKVLILDHHSRRPDNAALILLPLDYDLFTFLQLLYAIGRRDMFTCTQNHCSIAVNTHCNGSRLSCAAFGSSSCYDIHLLLIWIARRASNPHFAAIVEKCIEMLKGLLLSFISMLVMCFINVLVVFLLLRGALSRL